VGEGRTYESLLVGTVNIDEAFIGIDPRAFIDPVLKTFQPQNARQYQVLFDRALIPVDACIFAPFENAARRRARPDLIRDPMEARRCLERVLSNTGAEPGSGAIKPLDDRLLPADEERLRFDRLDEKKFPRVIQKFPQSLVNAMQPSLLHAASRQSPRIDPN